MVGIYELTPKGKGRAPYQGRVYSKGRLRSSSCQTRRFLPLRRDNSPITLGGGYPALKNVCLNHHNHHSSRTHHHSLSSSHHHYSIAPPWLAGSALSFYPPLCLAHETQVTVPPFGDCPFFFALAFYFYFPACGTCILRCDYGTGIDRCVRCSLFQSISTKGRRETEMGFDVEDDGNNTNNGNNSNNPRREPPSRCCKRGWRAALAWSCGCSTSRG